jgi:ribosomal protein S5
VKATLNGLLDLIDANKMAAKRGMAVEELFNA